MRVRLGLAFLFAVIAFAPLAVALEWMEDAREAVAREAREERADRVAEVWRAHVDHVLGAVEREARALCGASEGADAPGVVELPALGARLARRTGSATREWIAREGREATIERAIACGGGDVVVATVSLSSLADGRRGLSVVVPGADAPPPPDAGARRVVRAFRVRGGSEEAQLSVVVPAPARASGAADLELRLQVLALATVVIALLLGLVVGGRLTEPLGELEKAAERIGRGELDVKIGRASGSAGATFSAFNRMAEELRHAQARAKRAERVAAWRDIARRIAHEIKNPLTPIRMSIETMRRTKQRQHPDFDEIFDESTRTVLEEVERLERIVTEFSRFARLPRPEPVELDVREVVVQVVQLHSPGGDATITDTSPRLPIKMTLASDVPRVRADRDQLTQVLVNLVQNALDAAQSRHGDRGHVEVEVEADGEGGVRVAVSDDGPGIPPEERARVLEPYYTTKARGTGLGLAIVDRIVSEHGGTLDIGESRYGGARIAFTLPREGPQPEPEASQTL